MFDRLGEQQKMVGTAHLQFRDLPAGTFSAKGALDDGNAYGSSALRLNRYSKRPHRSTLSVEGRCPRGARRSPTHGNL